MSPYVRHRLGILAAIAALVLLLFVAITGPLRDRYQAAIANGADLAALKQRLERQLATLDRGKAGADLPATAIWSGAERADIESQIQDRVLETAEANQLQLTVFGPTAAPAGVKLPAVGYQIEAVASWDGLLRFIGGLHEIAPALGISELSLRGAPSSNAQEEPKVFLRLVVWGLAPSVGDDQ